MTPIPTHFDTIVIGGGHAGVEAAWAAANLGAHVALVTLDPSKIGVMSCNPAIGGLAKGQIVREIDALGGLMALATDATGIMFKILNTSRGPAVRGPRAQCDKHAYAAEVQRLIATRRNITIIPAAADEFIIDHSAGQRRVTGIVLASTLAPQYHGTTLHAPAIVLTTGTFMRGLMHTGQQQTTGGRAGEAPANGISTTLSNLGFELGRLKTGTPPRLKRSTIDWNNLDPQHGDTPPTPFSDMTDRAHFPPLPQVECRITSTNAAIHDAIRSNLDRAPLFTGQIDSAGPRYCPSIEDKVVRFADRESHHVFLEPESHQSDWVYCNGISTSLPADVQQQIVQGMPGCEHAEILQPGYAVEYDMVRPHQIDATCMTKAIDGLFLAGQINGTSGYEEAAGQGLLAGLNAVRYANHQSLITIGRDQAYIGVMMDDLVTKTPREPYRMFTSRAEYRLILRSDNAADRLTPFANQLGLIDSARWQRYQRREAQLATIASALINAKLEGKPLTNRMKQPRYDVDAFRSDLSCATAIDTTTLDTDAIYTTLASIQYDGYIKRQLADIKRIAGTERRPIPTTFSVDDVKGLRPEARQAMQRFLPTTIGQAGRLEGVNPADITLLLVAIERHNQANKAPKPAMQQ